MSQIRSYYKNNRENCLENNEYNSFEFVGFRIKIYVYFIFINGKYNRISNLFVVYKGEEQVYWSDRKSLVSAFITRKTGKTICKSTGFDFFLNSIENHYQTKYNQEIAEAKHKEFLKEFNVLLKKYEYTLDAHICSEYASDADCEIEVRDSNGLYGSFITVNPDNSIYIE